MQKKSCGFFLENNFIQWKNMLKSTENNFLTRFLCLGMKGLSMSVYDAHKFLSSSKITEV